MSVTFEHLAVGKRYKVRMVDTSSIVIFIGRLNVKIMADRVDCVRLIFDCAEINYTSDTTITFEELSN
jgi:hypothetical protein